MSTTYTIDDERYGFQPLNVTEPTAKHNLGTIVRGRSATLGNAQFVYLLGVASTAVGDTVCYNLSTFATTRAVAATQGQVAVAMSANVANQYGWYAIQGVVTATAAAAVAAGAPVYTTATAGAVDDAVVSGSLISGAFFAETAAAAGAVLVNLNYPELQ